LFGESRLLVPWCASGRCGMMCSDEYRGRSRRPDAEDRGWSHRSGTRWSVGAVCGLHCAHGDEKRGFLGWASKPRSRVYQWFGLKTTGTVWPQNRRRRFLGLRPKTGSYGLVIWASKSPRWFIGLDLKTNWASVCRLRHKTIGGRMTQDTRRDMVACFTLKQVVLRFPSLALILAEARQRVVHVAPSWRLRRNQVEYGWVDVMGYVGPYYPYFTVFYVLGRRGIIFF
jgi:hypothetical protein